MAIDNLESKCKDRKKKVQNKQANGQTAIASKQYKGLQYNAQTFLRDGDSIKDPETYDNYAKRNAWAEGQLKAVQQYLTDFQDILAQYEAKKNEKK